MPISDAELNKPVNACVSRMGEETVHAALQTWRDTGDSYEWWWLVIAHGEQHFTAVRFEGLRDMLLNSEIDVHMNTHLRDLPHEQPNPANPQRALPGVITPPVVQRAELDDDEAHQYLGAHPDTLVVVVEGSELKGIVSGAERQYGFSGLSLRALLEDFDEVGDADTLIVQRKRPPGA